MSAKESGITFYIPSPTDELVIDAVKTVPFKVKNAEIIFSPRQDLPDDPKTKIIPIRLTHEVKNQGSHNEPNIYYAKPSLELMEGDGLHWPSSLHKGKFQSMRYRFHETLYDERPLIIDFAARHLDRSQKSYLLLPEAYKFHTLHLDSESSSDLDHPFYYPDIKLDFSRENDDVSYLKLIMTESTNIRDALKFNGWFKDLAQMHGRGVLMEDFKTEA